MRKAGTCLWCWKMMVDFGWINMKCVSETSRLKGPRSESCTLCMALESHIDIREIENMEYLDQVIEINKNSQKRNEKKIKA